MKTLTIALVLICLCYQQCSAAVAPHVDGTEAQQGTSKSGYYTIDGRAYYINTDTRYTWLAASDACNARNMKLLSIESEQKNTAIVNFVRANGMPHDFWTSGYRIVQTWYWTGIGQSFGFSDWYQNEPDLNNESDACMFLWQAAGHKWADGMCNGAYTMMHICE